VLLLHQKGKLQREIGGEKIAKAEALAVRQRVNERKWKLQMQKEFLPPKDPLFMFMITSRLWKNFQFFKKSTNRSINLTTPLNARICTLEQTERMGFALCGLVEL
jgi:hypothetical protein